MSRQNFEIMVSKYNTVTLNIDCFYMLLDCLSHIDLECDIFDVPEDSLSHTRIANVTISCTSMW